MTPARHAWRIERRSVICLAKQIESRGREILLTTVNSILVTDSLFGVGDDEKLFVTTKNL